MIDSVTPEKLLELAKKHVDFSSLKKLLKDPTFRDFARIFYFMQLCSANSVGITNEPSFFGHCFVMKNAKGESIQIDVHLQLNSQVMMRN